MTSVPAHANPLTDCPLSHVRPNRIDTPCYFMARHSRILQTWPHALLHKHVTVTDSACLDLNTNRTWFWLRDITLDDLPLATRLRHLCGFHTGHHPPPPTTRVSVSLHHHAAACLDVGAGDPDLHMPGQPSSFLPPLEFRRQPSSPRLHFLYICIVDHDACSILGKPFCNTAADPSFGREPL